jgi:MFS family permease
MTLFYGWIIVAAGFVISCVGFGAMMALGVFLQPMATEMGWSRASISAAATLNFIAMGAGSFLWGALSDRFGTRAVLLGGGSILGLGLIASSQAATALQFQILFGALVGLGAGSFYAPLMSITTRWFIRHRSLAVALVSAGMSLGSTTVARRGSKSAVFE